MRVCIKFPGFWCINADLWPCLKLVDSFPQYDWIGRQVFDFCLKLSTTFLQRPDLVDTERSRRGVLFDSILGSSSLPWRRNESRSTSAQGVIVSSPKPRLLERTRTAERRPFIEAQRLDTLTDWKMRWECLPLCPTTKCHDLLKAHWIVADLSVSRRDWQSVQITFWQIIIWQIVICQNVIFNG